MPLNENSRRFLRANWILPVSQAAVKDACLLIEGKKIVGILSKAEYEAFDDPYKAERTVDYGDSVIMPGLINLHTHLDYSLLKHFDTLSPFFKWIRGLIGHSWQWSTEQWRQSALCGAREIVLSGTTCIADSSYTGAAAYGMSRIGLRGVVGLELFGIIEEKAEFAWDSWLTKYEDFFKTADDKLSGAIKAGLITVTVAPHTPYSVCPTLLKKALAWSRKNKLPMFLHIAESQAECQWIAGPQPEVDQFLYEATREEVKGGIGSLNWRGHGLTPVQHLEKHELLADNVLAAHLVKLNDEDIDLLALRQINAAHCPRSNSRLRNGVAPFLKLLKAGLNMGLGTDSAASTDDLNVLNEARFAWDLHRAVDTEFAEPSEMAIYYLTLGAARALKLDNLIGSLEPGKLADIAIFGLNKLPEIARENPADCLLYGGAELRDLYIDGVLIVKDAELLSAAETINS